MATLRWGAVTHEGQLRTQNEDNHHAGEGLFVVADGMGGHEAGEVASAAAVEALRGLPAVEDLDELVAQATEGLRRANGELIALAQSNRSERTIGTTVVGIAVSDGHFRCFWAGDSRAYRLRGGAIVRLSRDHSLVQDLVDAGMIKPEEAERHENSNVITRAVGVREVLEVDSVGGDAVPGDIFLLASDGLTRLVDDRELAAELGNGSLVEVADRLLETVLARGAPDNVSLIIIRIA